MTRDIQQMLRFREPQSEHGIAEQMAHFHVVPSPWVTARQPIGQLALCRTEHLVDAPSCLSRVGHSER